MEVRFKSLPHEDALSFAREYMGFTAEFAYKLARQITKNTETYLADLGALTVGTELTFSFNGTGSDHAVSGEDFPETPVVKRVPKRANVFRLQAAGDGVIATDTESHLDPAMGHSHSDREKAPEEIPNGPGFEFRF